MASSTNFGDNIKKFYHDVDRLCKLIEVGLEKRQTNNVERYLKYFFKTMIKYYEKIPLQDGQSLGLHFSQSENNNTSVSQIENFLAGVDRRQIQIRNEDFFVSKIKFLTFAAIEKGDFEVFYFIHNLINDSIVYLFNKDKLRNQATQLIGTFKFVSNYIVTRPGISARYNQRWFEGYTYQWFITLFSKSNIQTLPMLENELIIVLKDFVDNNRVDLFNKFLLSLSSSIFEPYSLNTQSIKNVLLLSQDRAFTFDSYYLQQFYKINKLNTVNSYLELSSSIVGEFLSEWNQFKSSDEVDLRAVLESSFFDLFKPNYLRIILIKAIIYALFKRKFEFLKVYNTYHQPEDSNAIWSNPNFGISKPQQVLRLLELRDDILSDHSAFWIDHHGFDKYFYTLMYYFLCIFDFDTFHLEATQLVDRKRIIYIKYEIEQMVQYKDLKILESLDCKQIEVLDERIKKLLEALNLKENMIRHQYIVEANVEDEVKAKFNQDLFNSYLKYALVRQLINYYFKGSQEFDSMNLWQVGTNALLPKEAFIKSETFYASVADRVADELAAKEDRVLLDQIVESVSFVNEKEISMDEFLRGNQSHYNVLINLGDFDTHRNISRSKDFIERWKIPEVENLPVNFQGKMFNHYQVYSYSYSEKCIVLLNSQNFVGLQNTQVELTHLNEFVEWLSVSFIDLSKTDDIRTEIATTGRYSESELQESVWFRVLESVRVMIAKENKPIGFLLQ